MRRRDDSGAVAIVVALLMLVLFGAAAFAVDLGNSYARARSTQAQADFAALTAADLLPATTPAQQLAAANEVADYINNHYSVQDDRPGGPLNLTGQQLLDQGLVTFPASNRIVVRTPSVTVQYGLARVLGANSQDVHGSATVEVRSLAGSAIMPLYVVAGCDYGQQVLKDQPNGQGDPNTVSMQYTSGGDTTNAVSLSGISRSTVTKNESPAPVLTLTGDFEGTGGNPKPLVDMVGFFPYATSSPPAPTLQAPTTASVTKTSLTVTVPSNVLATETVWYLRVHIGGVGGKWSQVADAKALTVGAASTPSCPAASNAGNFGQLGLGDLSNPNDDIATIMIHGPQHVIAPYDGTIGTGTCTGDPLPAIHYPTEEANCLRTETGFKPNAATAGLITGLNGDKGRLDEDTTSRCGSSRLSTALGSINNDYLSCFFTDGVTRISDIATPSYAGPAVLSPEIFDSPRFFYVPTFAVEPGNGQSAEYKVTGFRAAFLTEQDPSATRADGPKSGNGLTYQGNKVASMNVILFSDKALPGSTDSGAPTAPYYSFGPKVTVLVN